EQTDVGEHLELQMQLARFARRAGRRLPRRAIGGRLEVDVAATAAAAACNEHALTVLKYLADQLAGLGSGDNGAQRHVHNDVVSRLAGALATGAGSAVVCLELAGVTEVGQSVEPGIAGQPDLAT